MTFQFLGFLTVIIGVASLAAPVGWVFTILIISTVFGSAAAFNLPALGGASVLVPSLFLLFFGMRVFLAFGEQQLFAAFVFPRAGFILLVLTTFAVVSALFFPRLFEGFTETMIVERSIGARSLISLQPLHSTSNNITQSVYAVGGLVCFAFTFAFFRRTAQPSIFVSAIIIVSIINLSFAALDIVTYFSHTEYLLDFLHTANYALLTGAEKGGLKRISGSFPEASAFADFTLVLFAITASLWLERVRSRMTGVLSVLSLLALVLSTSATALLGLAAVLPVLVARSLAASHREPGGGRPVFIVAMIIAVPMIALFVPIFLPDVANNLVEFFNEMVLSKADSDSGRERFMWNAMAYQTFLDTSGLGAGLGSARASSFALVLLSNLGVEGALIFLVFVLVLLAANTKSRLGVSTEASAVARACKVGFLAALTTAMTSGTVYDLGQMFYILAGTIAALTSPLPVLAESLSLERRRYLQQLAMLGGWR
jgi:hypothetical protein